MADNALTSRAEKIEQAIIGIGACPALLEAIAATRRVGPRKVAVLVCGETGTGKERMARLVHEHSGRRGRFLAVNCSAVADGILESELFGHERGAFTGAGSVKRGLFEAADGGTLFLDEVAEMSPSLQAKLLRVLQEGCIRRVGGTHEIAVDVRMVSATHGDLRSMAADGDFRDDLVYRLDLPPLRDRGRDVVRIARHLLKTDPELAGERPWRLCRDADCELPSRRPRAPSSATSCASWQPGSWRLWASASHGTTACQPGGRWTSGASSTSASGWHCAWSLPRVA